MMRKLLVKPPSRHMLPTTHMNMNMARPHNPPIAHLGTSALGIVSATVALVTVLSLCMIRKLLVKPTSRHLSPRASGGRASSDAAHTFVRASAGRSAGE